MAKRRQAAPVTLTDRQHERLERLWFVYGNYGPKATPGNHQFIQGLLEHGLDLRPLQTKRTAKRDRPTEECEAAVEAILSSKDGGLSEAERHSPLWLVPSPDAGRKTVMADPGLKPVLDEMRRRLPRGRGSDGLDSGGKDAA